MSQLSLTRALALGRALLVAGGLLVVFTLLQAPDDVRYVSLVLGAIMLGLIALVALSVGISRSRNPATVPRGKVRPSRAWVWLNTVVLVGALAVLGANQFYFHSLVHDGPHRACARADVSPYHIDPTVDYDWQWSLLPPTLICHYSSNDGDPGKNFTADLFPAGAATFWWGLTAMACSITAGLLFRSVRGSRRSGSGVQPRETIGL